MIRLTYYLPFIWCSFISIEAMNTAVQRGTQKSAFEVIFGQKPNSFDSVGIYVSGIDSNDVNDIIKEGVS